MKNIYHTVHVVIDFTKHILNSNRNILWFIFVFNIFYQPFIGWTAQKRDSVLVQSAHCGTLTGMTLLEKMQRTRNPPWRLRVDAPPTARDAARAASPGLWLVKWRRPPRHRWTTSWVSIDSLISGCPFAPSSKMRLTAIWSLLWYIWDSGARWTVDILYWQSPTFIVFNNNNVICTSTEHPNVLLTYIGPRTFIIFLLNSCYF